MGQKKMGSNTKQKRKKKRAHDNKKRFVLPMLGGHDIKKVGKLWLVSLQPKESCYYILKICCRCEIEDFVEETHLCKLPCETL